MPKDEKIEAAIHLLNDATGNSVDDDKKIAEARGILRGILNTKDEDHQ